jgi:hypothetical protein
MHGGIPPLPHTSCYGAYLSIGLRHRVVVAWYLVKHRDNFTFYLRMFNGNLTDSDRHSDPLALHYKQVSLYEHEGVSKSFRTGRLEQELQMVQLSATGFSCIAIL